MDKNIKKQGEQAQVKTGNLRQMCDGGAGDIDTARGDLDRWTNMASN